MDASTSISDMKWVRCRTCGEVLGLSSACEGRKSRGPLIGRVFRLHFMVDREDCTKFLHSRSDSILFIKDIFVVGRNVTARKVLPIPEVSTLFYTTTRHQAWQEISHPGAVAKVSSIVVRCDRTQLMYILTLLF